MLALYTGKGVTPEVNLRERISHMPPHSLNKAEPTLALKPRGDVTRSPKQGYQWPHKWTCVQQNFFLKKKEYFLNFTQGEIIRTIARSQSFQEKPTEMHKSIYCLKFAMRIVRYFHWLRKLLLFLLVTI